ncbi:hypothetical protein ACP275_07G029300 [Erythranthe tilingii]
MNNNPTTAAAAAHLQEGINLLLSRWTALRMAVENEWGGRGSLQKSQQLGGDIFRLLTQSKDEVSIRHIADKLMVMHEECSEGNFGSIRSLRETNTPNPSYVRQVTSRGINDDEESEDDTLREDNSSEMEVDVPQCQTIPSQKDSVTDHTNTTGTPEVVDEWKVVCSKRSKSRKKLK